MLFGALLKRKVMFMIIYIKYILETLSIIQLLEGHN